MGFPVLEGVAGVVISLLIVRVGLELTWNSLLVLMDAVEDPDRLIDAKRARRLDVPQEHHEKGVTQANYQALVPTSGLLCMRRR